MLFFRLADLGRENEFVQTWLSNSHETVESNDKRKQKFEERSDKVE